MKSTLFFIFTSSSGGKLAVRQGVEIQRMGQTLLLNVFAASKSLWKAWMVNKIWSNLVQRNTKVKPTIAAGKILMRARHFLFHTAQASIDKVTATTARFSTQNYQFSGHQSVFWSETLTLPIRLQPNNLHPLPKILTSNFRSKIYFSAPTEPAWFKRFYRNRRPTSCFSRGGLSISAIYLRPFPKLQHLTFFHPYNFYK